MRGIRNPIKYIAGLIGICFLSTVNAEELQLQRDKCDYPCRFWHLDNYTFPNAIGTIQSMPIIPPNDPNDPGPPDNPGIPDMCGVQHCVLYADTVKGEICSNPYPYPGGPQCEWSQGSLVSRKHLDSMTICAADVCVPQMFGPYLHAPVKSFSFPSGTALVSPFSFDKTSAQRWLSVSNFFLNYTNIKMQAGIPLEIRNGYVVGKLPDTKELLVVAVELLAENKVGSVFYEFEISVVPTGSAGPPSP